MRSLEKIEGWFLGGVRGANDDLSETLPGGRGSGDHGMGMEFVGRGDPRALATRLSATRVSRRAVGAPATLRTADFSCQ